MASGFVPYLTLQDYLPSIQSGQLNQQILDAIEDGGTRQRVFAESWSMSLIRSKIGKRYDLDSEFTPTLPYDPLKKYGAGDRVVIDFPEWDEKIYDLFGVVIKDGYGYVSLVNQTSTVWDEGEWLNIGAQYDMYYVPYPFPLFMLNPDIQNGVIKAGFYLVGDTVYFGGHTYKSLNNTQMTSQEQAIQYGSYSSIPNSNVIPTDPIMGSYYWKDLGAYEFEAGSHPSHISEGVDTEWVLGDNRNPLLVQAVVDLSIWRLHNRISPNNIPQIRKDNFLMTLQWLNDVKKDEDQVDLNYSFSDLNFRGGSKVKNKNGIT